MSYDTNPFYNPDEFDPPLTLEASVSLNDEAYQFEYLAVWSLKSDPTRFFTASDSGCSCPTPFEDFNKLEDLTPVGQFQTKRLPREGEWCHQYYNDARVKEQGRQDHYLVTEQESFNTLREQARAAVATDNDRFYGTPPEQGEVEDFCKVLDALQFRAYGTSDAQPDPTVTPDALQFRVYGTSDAENDPTVAR